MSPQRAGRRGSRVPSSTGGAGGSSGMAEMACIPAGARRAPGRRPQTPPYVERVVVGQALAWPTWGCRRLSTHVADEVKVHVAPSTLQRLLKRLGLGRRRERLAALELVWRSTMRHVRGQRRLISWFRPSAKFSLDGNSLADLPMGLGRRGALRRMSARDPVDDPTVPPSSLQLPTRPCSPAKVRGGEPDRSIDKACERA